MQQHALARTELEIVVGRGTTNRGKRMMRGTGGRTVRTVMTETVMIDGMNADQLVMREEEDSNGRLCRGLCRKAMSGVMKTGEQTGRHLTQRHVTRTAVKSSM